jgi:hypothetical protein
VRHHWQHHTRGALPSNILSSNIFFLSHGRTATRSRFTDRIQSIMRRRLLDHHHHARLVALKEQELVLQADVTIFSRTARDTPSPPA